MKNQDVRKTTWAAWSKYFDRQRKDEPINPPADIYNRIVGFAMDVLAYKETAYQTRVKAGYRKQDLVWIDEYRNRDIAKAFAKAGASEDILWAACYVTGVKYDAAIKAARYINRLYNVGTGNWYPADLDEKLIRVLS